MIYVNIQNLKLYFFDVDDRKNNIFKIEQTKDIISRLNNYNVGRIKEIDLQNIKNLRFFIFCTKLK